MSVFGEDAARRLRALDPEASETLAAELRNAASPALLVAGILSGPLPDESADVRSTVTHLERLADILGGDCA